MIRVFPEFEEHYKKSFLAADIKQAKIGVLLLLLPLVVFFFNDYLFFMLSTEFYVLTALRLGLIVCTVLFLAHLNRLTSYSQYYRSEFAWGLAGIIFQLMINVSQSQNILFHVIMVIIIIFFTWLIVPQTFVNRTILSLTLTTGELAIITLGLSSLTNAALFTSIFTLILVNIIGLSMSMWLGSYRLKKAEESLTETKDFLDDLLNCTNTSIFVWDNEKKIIMLNKAFEAFTGYSKEFMLGKNIEMLFPDSHKTTILETVEKATRGEKWQQLEVPVVCKNGKTRVALWDSTNVPDKNGKIVSTMAEGQDITERKKMEAELRKSELFLQCSSDSIVVTDLEGKVTSWNRGATEIFGYGAQEMLGEPVTKLAQPGEKEKFASGQLESIRAGQVISGEWEGVRKDGSSVRLILAASLLKDFQNEPIGMVGFGKDITEHRKTVEALRESEQKLRSVLAACPEALTICDLTGCIVECNQATLALLGYGSKEELIGKNLFDVMAKKDCERVLKWIATFSSLKNLEFTFVAKDGRKFPGELSANVVLDALGKQAYYVAIAKDVTERLNLRGS